MPAEVQAQAATLLMGGGQVCASCRDKASCRGSASVPAEVQAQAATPLVGGGQVCASDRVKAPLGQPVLVKAPPHGWEEVSTPLLSVIRDWLPRALSTAGS